MSGNDPLEIKLIEAISKCTQNTVDTKEEKRAYLYGLDKVIEVPVSIAAAILSLDEKGIPKKKNLDGNNIVEKVGDVYFKQSNDPAGIRPVYEQAIYQVSRLIGSSIITPSKLIRIDMPDKKSYFVQASLSAEKISQNMKCERLDLLLHVPGCLNGLKELLGEEKLLDNLAELVNQNYIKEYKDNCSSEPVNWDQQVDQFLLCYKPKELEEKDEAKTKISIDKIKSAINHIAITPLIALIKKIPELRRLHLGDFVFFHDVFKLLKILYYPNRLASSAEMPELLRKVEGILSNFDSINMAQHILLALLTYPGDHKSDNFKVLINHDAQGDLLPFKLIAFDSDKALEKPFSASKDNLNMKFHSILFCIRNIYDMPINSEVKAQLLSIESKHFVLHWLEEICFYSRAVKELTKSVVSDFKSDEDTNLYQVKNLIENQFLKLQHVLRNRSIQTLGNLISEAEPEIFKCYQLKIEYDPDSVRIENELREMYDKDPLHNKLGVEEYRRLKDRVVNTCASYDAQQKYSNFDEGLLDLIQTHNMTSFSDVAQQIVTYGALLKLNLMPSDNTFSVKTFIKLYQENGLNFLKGIVTAKSVTIDLHTRPSQVLDLNDPFVLFNLIKNKVNQEATELLKILIIFKISIDIRQPENQYTLLHYAASLNSLSAMKAIIKYTSQLEEFDNSILPETALDKSIISGYFEASKMLICYGAGRELQLKNGLEFIREHEEKDPDVCQSLLNINPGLCWQVGLEEISQENIIERGVEIYGFDKVRYLKPEYYKQLFPTDDTAFPKENIYGRSRGTQLSWKSKKGLCGGFYLKEKPGLVGREFMAHYLSEAIWHTITPPIRLFRFCRLVPRSIALFKPDREYYPVLASCTVVQGVELVQVIQNESILKKLDTYNQSQNIILAMLLNPEDGRADNYLIYPIQKKGKTKYYISTIDNEKSFVQPIKLKDDGREIPGPDGLSVKTILFCLDCMLDEVDGQVVHEFLQLNTFQILQAWLKKLSKEFGDISETFTLKEINELSLGFIPSIINELYDKIEAIKSVLSENPCITHIELLKKVIPELGWRYSKALTDYPTPNERFRNLTEGQFDEKIIHSNYIGGTTEIVSASKTPSIKIIELTKERSQRAKERGQEKEIDPEKALKHLKIIDEDNAYLKIIRAELEKGRIDKFVKLELADQFDKVINGYGEHIPVLDFSKGEEKLDSKRQKIILGAIKKAKLTRLRLINCDVLTDTELKSLLTFFPKLSVLELNNCKQLTNLSIRYISQCCGFIEKLILKNCNITEISNIRLLRLRMLSIEECYNLVSVDAETPPLEKLNITSCPRLRYFNLIAGSKPHEIKISSCYYLESSQLFEVKSNKIGSPRAITILSNKEDFLNTATSYITTISDFIKTIEEGYFAQGFYQKKNLMNEVGRRSQEFFKIIHTWNAAYLHALIENPKIPVISCIQSQGVTSLVNRLINNKFDTNPKNSKSRVFSKKVDIDGVSSCFEFIDVPDQSFFYHLRNASVIMLCHALDEGFESDDRLVMMISHIQESFKDKMILLVGTKADIKQAHSSFEERRNFAKKQGLSGYIDCSSKTGEGVKDVLGVVSSMITESMISSLSSSTTLFKKSFRKQESVDSENIINPEDLIFDVGDGVAMDFSFLLLAEPPVDLSLELNLELETSSSSSGLTMRK